MKDKERVIANTTVWTDDFAVHLDPGFSEEPLSDIDKIGIIKCYAECILRITATMSPELIDLAYKAIEFDFDKGGIKLC